MPDDQDLPRTPIARPELSADHDERRLREWASRTSSRDVPPHLTTLVSGEAQVGAILNIASADTVNVLEQAAPTSLFGLPRDIADFTGRHREVAELVALLGGFAESGPVVISALAGKPGVGKSALALHVAHRLRGRYPDAQLYVNLQGLERDRPDPGSVLGGLLENLGLPGKRIPPELDRRASMYRSQLAGRRALIVLDNAHDEAQVRPLLPGSATCAVLITSRAPLASLEGAVLHTLEVMDREAARELLAKIAGPDRVGGEPEECDRIVELCGRLPLAVRIAGALLAKQPAWALKTLAGKLQVERHRLDVLHVGDLEVRASFALSYEALDTDAQRVFRGIASLRGPDFGPEIAAAIDDGEVATTRELLDRLADAQLLETPTEARYRFHDLIALFARERARIEDPAAELEAAERARAWYQENASHAATLLGADAADLERVGIDPVAAHGQGLQWLAIEHASLIAVIEQAHEAGDWHATRALTTDLVEFLSIRARWDDWRRIEELALDAAQRLRDRHGEATSLNRLGIIDARSGRWDEAIDRHRRSMRIMAELCDRHGEAQALGNLGIVYARQGRWDLAASAYQQCLETTRAVGDRHGEEVILNSLGALYHRQSRWAEAGDCFEQSLQITREIGDRHGEARALDNLGVILTGQAHHEDAISYFEQSLQISRELGDRHGEAEVIVNLAKVYAAQDRSADALSQLRRGAETLRELGDPHGEAQALLSLGQVLRREGRWAEATDCYEQDLQIRRALGDPHGEGTTLNSLGLVYLDRGLWDAAIDRFEQSLQVMRDLGDRHGEAQALINLGGLYGDRGREEDGAALLEQSLTILRELGDRRGEAQALLNLGLVLYREHRREHAIERYEQSAQVMRELGDRRGEAQVLGNLGVVYAEVGRAEEATRCTERHLQVTRELGDRHGEAQALLNLGLDARRAGDREAAVDCTEQSLEIMSELGDRHGEAQALINRGVLYAENGSLREAASSYEAGLVALREVADRYGEGQALKNLGAVRMAQGQLDDARACFAQSLRAMDEVGDREGAALVRVGLEQLERLEEQAAHDAAATHGADSWTVLSYGFLLAEQGDVNGACAIFQHVIDSANADVAPVAALQLGSLLQAQGDAAGARAAYQRTVASGHPDYAPVAARHLEALDT